MEDTQIIDLYWQRNESAIKETSAKYSSYCRSIAVNVLGIPEDAEECVNDTWYHAWNAIPPEKPNVLKVWLGRITRNLSLDRWRKDHAKKRCGGMETLLSELEECLPIPESEGVEVLAETQMLTDAINHWLEQQSEKDRALFVQRYWYGESVKELSQKFGVSRNSLAKRLFRLRASLRKSLEKEMAFVE